MSLCVCVQCIIWNVADESAVSKISVHHDTIYSISWNHNGSAFATTCKDKMIRVIDPRSGLVIAVCIRSTFNSYLQMLYYRTVCSPNCWMVWPHCSWGPSIQFNFCRILNIFLLCTLYFVQCFDTVG